MSHTVYYILWSVLYILCVVLGFMPEVRQSAPGICTGASILFFLPPALLLLRAKKQGDTVTLKRLRLLAGLSLGITLVLLVLNFLCVTAAQWVGDTLYALLVMCSSPMVCSGRWAVSLFLWACLLCASHSFLKVRP